MSWMNTTKLQPQDSNVHKTAICQSPIGPRSKRKCSVVNLDSAF